MEPARRVTRLSRKYDSPLYVQSKTAKAKWTPIRTTTIDCDECFALQVETNGGSGSRFAAKHRRTLAVTDVVLNLCNAHAEQWRERDAA